MIVRTAAAHLIVITQPDHARLSADLISAWQADGFPQRPTRAALLHATANHDYGWIEEDARPRVSPDSARPYDFMNLPIADRQAIWPRAIEALSATSTYVAALVAQHALTIYRRFRSDPAWASFFAGIERERDRLYSSAPETTSGTPADLEPPGTARLAFLQDYSLLRIGDLLSLMFCNGWTEPQELDGYTLRLESDQLIVDPDPFGGRTVPFSVRARRIADTRYGSDRELRDALVAAPFDELTGTAVGGVAV